MASIPQPPCTKGALLVYNHQTQRKTPFIGKHQKKITCGAWSSQNVLVLGAEDNSITVSNSDGDTLSHNVMMGAVSDIQIFDSPAGAKIAVILTANNNVTTLYLTRLHNVISYPFVLLYLPWRSIAYI